MSQCVSFKAQISDGSSCLACLFPWVYKYQHLVLSSMFNDFFIHNVIHYLQEKLQWHHYYKTSLLWKNRNSCIFKWLLSKMSCVQTAVDSQVGILSCQQWAIWTFFVPKTRPWIPLLNIQGFETLGTTNRLLIWPKFQFLHTVDSQ